MKEKHITKGKNVGKKQEDLGKSKKSYIIYDSCYTCPLKAYIQVVCNGDMRALVLEGEPTDEELNMAFSGILEQYQEISGNKPSLQNSILREIYMYRSHILGLALCYDLVLSGEIDLKGLNDCGITFNPSKEDEFSLLEKISMKIKDRKIRLKKAIGEYDRIQKNNKSEKVTMMHFVEQLASLSRWAGFRLSDEITLAEYAVYTRQMNDYAEQLKTKRNGNKYK